MNMLHFFLPKKIKGHFTVPMRVLHITYTRDVVVGVLLVAKNQQYVVEKVVQTALAQGAQESIPEILLEALRVTAKQFSFDYLITTLDSSQLIIKEIRTPLQEYQQIKKILPFELEAQVPFPLTDAAYDFIMVPGNGQEHVVFVALTKRDLVEETVSLFREAGLTLDA